MVEPLSTVDVARVRRSVHAESLPDGVPGACVCIQRERLMVAPVRNSDENAAPSRRILLSIWCVRSDAGRSSGGCSERYWRPPANGDKCTAQATPAVGERMNVVSQMLIWRNAVIGRSDVEPSPFQVVCSPLMPQPANTGAGRSPNGLPRHQVRRPVRHVPPTRYPVLSPGSSKPAPARKVAARLSQ